MNKDLVLREHLAIERTRLANETTLLAVIRTGLYFLVAGSTLGEIVDTKFWKIAGLPLIAIGFLIVLAGVVRFIKVKKLIAKSRENIGHSSTEFIRMVRGTADVGDED
jgi:putative membrane protein